MSQEEVPAAVVNGRRVAMALLLLAMATTLGLVIWLVAWWMTRPVVI